MVVALVLTGALVVLVLFQVALALGAPWGRFAWGGSAGALPVGLRIVSAASALVYAVIAGLALDLAGALDLLPNKLSHVGIWVAADLLPLGVVLNALSRSRPQRLVMVPVSVVLVALTFVVALAGPVPRQFAGAVVDAGQGPRHCTVVMASYPPRCGPDSPVIDGWDWTRVAHQRSGTVRWGDYRFEGIRDRGRIALVGPAVPIG
ncbi:hypothetical protein GA0111570_10420 [Raineyella antarctica]|uniref:Uncharacterized protein n=1 Tax=Raineyella antarctica TaxID=1577474 RepID=A0A1G6GKN3_9ACTN|nr:hypothetical protein [Raineyella antarctica]SDB82592.1 hypothetical protein GA0111570_10420 [Raineyella antarctica]